MGGNKGGREQGKEGISNHVSWFKPSLFIKRRKSTQQIPFYPGNLFKWNKFKKKGKSTFHRTFTCLSSLNTSPRVSIWRTEMVSFHTCIKELGLGTLKSLNMRMNIEKNRADLVIFQ